ncbi:Zinc transporter 2 [Plakobranchus ocellatus]|uniref:Zinc transporter 2 n=1 Tax=Plakobranchus ocellatus TaxID=259542 RepID=A0AAV3YRC4_9GAST|nr:Zinc transporter 2 [Plakobranchus ocellatus]
MTTSVSIPHDVGKDKCDKDTDNNMLPLLSSSGSFGERHLAAAPEKGEHTPNSRSAWKYVPSKGEFFEKRETRLDNDRKRVTYILQTSGSHDQPRKSDDRPSSDERTTSTDSHCHSLKPRVAPDRKARRKLVLASVLCLLFMTGETAGGLIAGSLAIISDAAHLLTDFASFMISLMALYLAHRPATKRLSFGWYRIEILGALLSILMLWVLTGILVYSAVERVRYGGYEIDATVMLITAATGVAFNIVHGHSHNGGQGHTQSPGLHRSPSTISRRSQSLVASADQSNDEARVFVSQSAAPPPSSAKQSYGTMGTDPELRTAVGVEVGAGEDQTSSLLSRSLSSSEDHDLHPGGHQHNESNINVKAAFIHVLGDLFQSIGVLVAAFIIYFKPEWKIADPICTFLFSLFVLITTITILRDILVVLMEGTPRGINFAEVREVFFEVEGVLDIHNLRVWSLTMDKIALSVHIAVDKSSDPHDVLRRASSAIQNRFAISETTMQIEEYVTEMDDCADCQGPKL